MSDIKYKDAPCIIKFIMKYNKLSFKHDIQGLIQDFSKKNGRGGGGDAIDECEAR